MDRDKLAQLRKKKAKAKANEHKQLLDSNASIAEAIVALHETINGKTEFDGKQIVDQLKVLEGNLTFKEEIKALENSLKVAYSKPLKVDNLDKLIKAVGENNNKDIVDAVNKLTVKLEDNTVSQKPSDFQPVRRVIKVGTRLVFDDDKMHVSVGGGGGGVNITTLAKENKQDEQSNLLKQIRGFDIPEYDEIELSYTGDNLTQVEYLNAATLVATLTLAYTGDKLTNVSIS